MTTLKAIVFDCDGVIADSEPLHLATLQDVLTTEGIALSEDLYNREYLALDDRGAFRKAFREHGIPLDDRKLHELMEIKAARLEPVMQTDLRIFPGVARFIRSASESYPLAIASGALRHEIELILKCAGVSDCFAAIISAEDVSKGKPDPESFVAAHAFLSNRSMANRGLSIDHRECLVIEDSLHGVDAARLAGMPVLAVTNSYPREQLASADAVIDTFVNLTPADVERMIFKANRQS